jgi:hypothetical protein
MVLLGKPEHHSASTKPVVVMDLNARPPWVCVAQEQLPKIKRGFVWGVVDSGNGLALSVHRSKRAAAKEATWYNKTERVINAQLSGR